MPPKKQNNEPKKKKASVEDKVCHPRSRDPITSLTYIFFFEQTFGMKNVCSDLPTAYYPPLSTPPTAVRERNRH